jgi:hypothetical protein
MFNIDRVEHVAVDGAMVATVSHNEVTRLMTADAERMRLLGIVRNLHLPDCWVGAGFVPTTRPRMPP